MIARIPPLLLLLLLLAPGCADPSLQESDVTGADLASAVTIYRDDYGVPHVYGETDAATAFGFAYAQAEDNYRQIEDNMLRAVGRASERHGAETLFDDWINAALEIPRLSKEEYEASAPGLRGLLDGYAAGLNAYLDHHPKAATGPIRHYEGWHPLALVRYLYYQRGFFRAARVPREALEAGFREATGAAVGTAMRARWQREQEGMAHHGSNAWGVSPKKSTSGHALLFINPHLAFFGPSQVYEGHVMSASGWNFSGYTRFGFPFPYVGFNDHLGWASTDNAADLSDVYVETFDDPQHPLAYRYGDGYRTATEWTDTLLVRREDRMDTVAVTLRKTHHGPVVGETHGRSMAVRMARYEQPGWMQEWYDMTRATSLDAFTAAAARLDMLFGNYLYADRDGNIFYAYNAAVPRRDTTFDWRRPVDGSNPATEWNGYHSMDEIPQVLNPEAGYLQNANTSPFLSSASDNPDPSDFPNYMVREGDNARAQNARRILESREHFTFDQWATASYDTYVIQADDVLPRLEASMAWLRRADPARADTLAAPAALLGDWDHVSTTASEAMTLYVLTVEHGLARAADAHDDPATIDALADAVHALEHDWGTWRVPWGEMNRLQRIETTGETAFRDDHPSVAAAGAPTWAGPMFTLWAPHADGLKRRYGVGGNSYVSVVEFGPEVRARSLRVFGASADPSSPHYDDQTQRYLEGDYKPAWLTLDDVRAHAARSYHPGEE